MLLTGCAIFYATIFRGGRKAEHLNDVDVNSRIQPYKLTGSHGCFNWTILHANIRDRTHVEIVSYAPGEYDST